MAWYPSFFQCSMGLDVVVQLENSRLLKSDYDLLDKPSEWFTDSLIAVWFEYLETYVFGPESDAKRRQGNLEEGAKVNAINNLVDKDTKKDILEAQRSKSEETSESMISGYRDHGPIDPTLRYCGEIKLLDPSVAFLILHENDPDDLRRNLEALRLESKTTICIPINDSMSPTAPCSGTHWSLLVYTARPLVINGHCTYPGGSKSSELLPQFVHINSVSDSYCANACSAHQVATKLAPLLLPPALETSSSTSGIQSSHTPQRTIDVTNILCGPQKDHGSCGVWVILIAEEICSSILENRPAKLNFEGSAVRVKRQSMKRVLRRFKVDNKQR